MNKAAGVCKPFFSFYGAKWRAAKLYPPPTCGRIVEPFAGAAGYATRHASLPVTLYDADPVIAGVWNYLIHVKLSEFLRLRVDIDRADVLRAPVEAIWFVGFCMDHGTASPTLRRSKWGHKYRRTVQFWSEELRDRIAYQLAHIRHWKCYNKGYEFAPNRKATWFIDPPYNNAAGERYKFKPADYAALGEWCQTREGQVIVCENAGAKWLPFRNLASTLSCNRKGAKSPVSQEVIWTNQT